jgi:hypothetical protein
MITKKVVGEGSIINEVVYFSKYGGGYGGYQLNSLQCEY